jgi:hypothetical protein
MVLAGEEEKMAVVNALGLRRTAVPRQAAEAKSVGLSEREKMSGEKDEPPGRRPNSPAAGLA